MGERVSDEVSTVVEAGSVGSLNIDERRMKMSFPWVDGEEGFERGSCFVPTS